jgi:flagellar assembly protein FliH
LQQTATGPESSRTGQIDIFEYPDSPLASYLPVWNGFQEAVEDTPKEPALDNVQEEVIETTASGEFGQRLAEETRRSFEAGRERGNQEGRQAEREALTTARAEEENERKRQDAKLIESFVQERDRYLQTVEHEVVRLALAVAARILRREAQMDPLLLTGAVRVALGQLAGSTEVRLRVPAADLDLWKDAIALLPNLTLKPVVITGEGMRLGDCEIETAMGSVDLGIRSQLGEIERGFFDRAGAGRQELAAARNDAPATSRESH